MRSLKYAMIALALVTVAMLFAPQYAAAASDQQTTIIDAQSIHKEQYDEVVNVANDTSVMNPSTWNPMYQGMYMGASTRESLFSINQVTLNGTTLWLTSEFVFSTSQILSGISESVVRLPILMESGMVRYPGGFAAPQIRLMVYLLEPATTYDFAISSYGSAFSNDISFDGNVTNVCEYWVDPADSSLSDGDDQWTIDGRTYVQLLCPLLPEQRYLFALEVGYSSDQRMQFYISPNDIAGDNITHSEVSYGHYLNPAEHVFFNETLPVDLGWSFDFRSSLGNGIFAKSFYLTAGTMITWLVYPNDTEEGFHSVMLPFYKENHTASFSIEVYDDSDLLWYADPHIFQDYVLLGSGASHSFSYDYPGDHLVIELTAEWDMLLTLYYVYQPGFSSGFADPGGSIFRQVYAVPMSSYQITNNEITEPNAVYIYGPPNPDQMMLSWQQLGLVLGIIVTVGGVVLMVICPPVGIAVAGLGVSMIIASNWEKLKDAAENGYLWFKNQIDAAWDALKAFGNFLNSIGEMILQAFNWLWDQIIEYGSYLLALLVVGVALAIFIFALWGQLKIYSIFLNLAKGKVDAAKRDAQDLANVGAGAAKAGGKLL